MDIFVKYLPQDDGIMQTSSTSSFGNANEIQEKMYKKCRYKVRLTMFQLTFNITRGGLGIPEGKDQTKGEK